MIPRVCSSDAPRGARTAIEGELVRWNEECAYLLAPAGAARDERVLLEIDLPSGSLALGGTIGAVRPEAGDGRRALQKVLLDPPEAPARDLMIRHFFDETVPAFVPRLGSVTPARECGDGLAREAEVRPAPSRYCAVRATLV